MTIFGYLLKKLQLDFFYIGTNIYIYPPTNYVLIIAELLKNSSRSLWVKSFLTENSVYLVVPNIYTLFKQVIFSMVFLDIKKNYQKLFRIGKGY